jgi:hypothetical protein
MQNLHSQNSTVQSDHRPTVDEVTRETALSRPVIITFAHLDPLAMGVAVGVVFGFWVFLATAILLIRGGNVIGPNLWLLSHYFIGFSVSWPGAIVGFLYGGVCGFIFGYTFSLLRNFLIHLYLIFARRRAERQAAGDLP